MNSKWQWIAKGSAIVLSLLLFWLSYGNYALVQGSEFRKQSVQLLKAQDSLIWKQKALDSLAHHASLLQGLYSKQMLAMDQVAPSIDSLRKMAEIAGLQVSQLESNPSPNTGFVAIERIGIDGTPLQVAPSNCPMQKHQSPAPARVLKNSEKGHLVATNLQ